MWDWDEHEIDIKDRQHHVDFDPSLYVLKKELLELEAKKNPLAQEALIALENVQSAADLGCGSGHSTRAIEMMCSKLHSVDMVDGQPVINSYVVDELKDDGLEVKTFPETQISDYINTAQPNSKDMIFFGNVLNHELKPEDIQRMAALLHENGIVFETDQTDLDKDEMKKYFKELYHRSGAGFTSDIIWKKKHE